MCNSARAVPQQVWIDEGFDPDFVATLPVQRLAHGGALYVSDMLDALDPPILFVHGGYHGAWCFGAWMRRLGERGVAAAAIDLAGHGFLAHEGLSPSVGIDDYAMSIVEAAALLGCDVTIVGHSLGALSVATAAVHVRAAGFVLLAPSPPANLPGAARVSLLAEGAPVPPPPREEADRRYFAGRIFNWTEAYYRLLCAESPAAMNDRYALKVSVDPAPLTGKTKVISAGLDDPVRHPEGQDAALARFYGASYRTLSNAAHCMMSGPHSQTSLDALLDWHRRAKVA